jgi:mevalonate kinase
MQTFYSNGKLFIIGEYYVLEGAKVFALPTKFGQYLNIKPNDDNKLIWKSFDSDMTLWYDDEILISDILNNNTTYPEKIKNTLIDILYHADKLNPNILKTGYDVETKLTFPRNWGLGTSSTLINNIAQWFKINAYELLKLSFGGSGYDIACAQNNTPITYKITNSLPIVSQVKFDPNFKNKIYFVYLNIKKDSKDAISNFRKKQKELTHEVIEVSNQTDQLLNITDFEEFKKLIQTYENNLSNVLEIDTIQKQLFSDFNGVIKSLGGWGGDFVMVLSEQNPTSYFENKGYKTVLPYEKMIL